MWYPSTSPGVQFHPEKVPFEWHSPVIPHSPAALAVSAYFAQFLAHEAGRSGAHFRDPAEEEAALIYNYHPTYTARYGPFRGFMQCYLF